MSGDNMKMGEGLGAEVKKPDSSTDATEVKPEEKQVDKKTLRRRRIIGYGTISIIATIIAVFGWIKTYEAVTEYSSGDNIKLSEGVKHKMMQGHITLKHLDSTGVVLASYGPYQNTIVNVGENFMVDAFQNSVELETLKYHGLGTSSGAIAETDTGCTTELTTQYSTDNTRATGTTTEGTGTNVYRTVATNTVDAGVTIQEFCLMSQAAVGGGVMWSRILTGSIALNSGDSLQTTYDLTVE